MDKIKTPFRFHIFLFLEMITSFILEFLQLQLTNKQTGKPRMTCDPQSSFEFPVQMSCILYNKNDHVYRNPRTDIGTLSRFRKKEV